MKSRYIKIITLILIYSIVASLLFTACDFIELEVSSPESTTSSSQPDQNSSSSASVTVSEETSEEESITESSVEESEESVVSEPEESKVIETPIKQDTDLHGFSIEECNDFFDDAVFFGDSVMQGFEGRINDRKLVTDEYFGDIDIFGAQNLGYRSAVLEMKEGRTTYNPQYLGDETYIWDIISDLKPERVFLLFGLNDLAGQDCDIYTFSSMKKLVQKIEDTNPDVEIVILSTTYYTRNGENKYSNRSNEYNRNLNEMMLQYCNENGMDFIDVATGLTDDEGYLIDEYSSDDYVHLHYFAYDYWVDVLRGYAADKMLNQYTNVETMLPD